MGNANKGHVRDVLDGDRSSCSCGARRIDSQLGLEPTPDQYVQNLVEVFREVRRVLRDDGTVWLNLGDSYAGSWGARGRENGFGEASKMQASQGDPAIWGVEPPAAKAKAIGLKPKDLVGIPWRVAFALQQPYYAGKIKDEKDRIWLAAMIDAEGCMFIHKRKEGQSNGQGYVRKNDSYGAGLEVANCSEAVVRRCMEITGLGSICHQDAGRKQRIYRWNLRSNVCRDVIKEVYPYLVAKQHEARLLLGCPSSGERAQAAHEALKLLHNGGSTSVDFAPPESLWEGGWFLRSDCIWSKKPNPMPESVRDRPTRSHEYIFLLSKSSRYYWDQEAVREKNEASTVERFANSPGRSGALKVSDTKYAHRDDIPHQGLAADSVESLSGRNIRSVWNIATQPYKEAHFATFPEKLVEPCILAGSSPKACGECGAPWERVTGRDCPECGALIPTQGKECAECGFRNTEWREQRESNASKRAGESDTVGPLVARKRDLTANSRSAGLQPTCTHADDSGQSLVLDPFAGSGTVGVVALRHGRSFIGLELNHSYCQMAAHRIQDDAPLLNEVRLAA